MKQAFCNQLAQFLIIDLNNLNYDYLRNIMDVSMSTNIQQYIHTYILNLIVVGVERYIVDWLFGPWWKSHTCI